VNGRQLHRQLLQVDTETTPYRCSPLMSATARGVSAH